MSSAAEALATAWRCNCSPALVVLAFLAVVVALLIAGALARLARRLRYGRNGDKGGPLA